MFGYVKPDIPELKVKDNELYKATYCGLCKTMGKCTGCISRLTLNYDFVFLALVRMVLENVKGNVRMRRCMLHPLKKRPVLVALFFALKRKIRRHSVAVFQKNERKPCPS